MQIKTTKEQMTSFNRFDCEYRYSISRVLKVTWSWPPHPVLNSTFPVF